MKNETIVFILWCVLLIGLGLIFGALASGEILNHELIPKERGLIAGITPAFVAVIGLIIRHLKNR